MNNRPFILYVSSNTTTGGAFFAKSIEMGFVPVLITADPSRFSFLKETDTLVAKIDENDTDALRAFALDFAWNHQVAAVMSTSDFYQATAADIANLLGLASRDGDALRFCRNKGNQRHRLSQAGIQQPRYWTVSSIEQAVAAFEECGVPVVIKPIDGSGSVGVSFADDIAMVEDAVRALLSNGTNERGLSKASEILIEECIEGPEYSIEVFDGEVIGVTQKHLGPKPSFVEIGHTFPAPLGNSDHEKLCGIAIAATESLELISGPVHIEAKLLPGAASIIEVNARLAGGYIPRIVELTGTDLISMTIALATGTEGMSPRAHSRSASIRFVIPDSIGRIAAISGVAATRSSAGIIEAKLYKQVGDDVAIYGDFRDRIGHVIAVGDDSTESDAVAISALRQISILTIGGGIDE